MTYEVYITKDYKPVIREVHDSSLLGNRGRSRILALALCVTTGLILGMRSHDGSYSYQSLESELYSTTLPTLDDYSTVTLHEQTPVAESQYTIVDQNTVYLPQSNIIQDDSDTLVDQNMVEQVIPSSWDSLEVKSGDSLSLIFDRLHISPQILHDIMSLGRDVEILKRLTPSHEMRFQLEDGKLTGLQYDINLTDTLHITKVDTGYSAETVTKELETRLTSTSGIISHSLFLTAQRSGLSDNLTMQLVDLFGWDIDFALDIHEGDRFYVLYEEKFKDGVKVQDGAILAAEFVNQDKSFRAVRYTHSDGYTDYYNEDGYSMRKAFLRTPVNFTRISSGFSLGRRHPVLNTIRAHRGVDYAAPTGTPIKATGDGIVALAGYKGGYGKVVILRHGEKYSTLYGHMSKFAKGISSGQRVKQGQTIGYVGMTGLATGPHLHYEFRINDIHHNPLTVELPKAMGISKEIMNDFKQATAPVLVQLDNVIAGKAFQTAAQGNQLLR